MLQFGVEMTGAGLDQEAGRDVHATARRTSSATAGDLVVHPPVGKWVIAVGEQLFGVTSSFGWRFSVALLGTLSILMVGRAARRMFGSTLLGTVAAAPARRSRGTTSSTPAPGCSTSSSCSGRSRRSAPC